ncbi:hypothetical protein L6164_002057 [Bauhinia variegata]|uniref:Uncharacterized protein n=1 Tax=Bauhinia variegata TaxID=167791 RepID=A0ACB9PX65_BAUVA|nr:hypothetical protein L6164_002057 [Bauhinia variegata]
MVNREQKQAKNLDWSFRGSQIHTNDSYHEKNVLDSLRPHPGNLKWLQILNYTGTGFPEWVGDPSFSNLVSVKLIGCKYCCMLPPFGQLPSLKYLHIQQFEGLVVIGPEFYGPTCADYVIQPFASMEFLTFDGVGAWEIWSHVAGNESYKAFPSLKSLGIINCPRLIGDLPGNLGSKAVSIDGCPKLSQPMQFASIFEHYRQRGCAIAQENVRDSDLTFL